MRKKERKKERMKERMKERKKERTQGEKLIYRKRPREQR